MSGCRARIPGFEFSQSQIEAVIENSGLLSMEMEFSLKCNLRCPYCYVPDKNHNKYEMTKDELCDVIVQAQGMGAQKIVILGGEPMIYPAIFEMIAFIHGRGLRIELFTNGTNVTAENAKRLFDSKVNVVLKMNSFAEETQDTLAGMKGAYKTIQDALANLRAAGYPSEEPFLAVSTVVCKQNCEEIITLWRWARDQGIVPYIEALTPQGHAWDNDWLTVEPGKLREIFQEISKIDREEYGRVWEPQPPLVGHSCLRHSFSCLISPNGDVVPCVGVRIPVGNIRRARLHDIIAESEVMQDLRNHRNTIKGPCASCEKSDRCYGCRGAAFNLTGDYLASDPLCWKNIDRQDEIDFLPVSVVDVVPHKKPMSVVNELLSMGERSAEVSVTLSRDMPFVLEDGTLDECAHLEIIAQSVAAAEGFRKKGSVAAAIPEGLLLGAKKLVVTGTAKVGDVLKVSLLKTARFGDFSIIEGKVRKGNDVIAEGEIKIWRKLEAAGAEQHPPSLS